MRQSAFFYATLVSMKHGKRDFDSVAADWDEKPGRAELASDVARAIREEVPLTAEMDILDFGCGTGLVTLALQPYVRTVTGVDSSRGMLDVLGRKIREKNLANVKTIFLDMEQGNSLSGCYHLIVSSMTLHHVEDIGKLLAQFYRALLPSGCLCIADLDREGGRFHDDKAGVIHSGFDRTVLTGELFEAGFVQVRDRTAAAIDKTLRDGSTAEFTVFLMTARK